MVFLLVSSLALIGFAWRARYASRNDGWNADGVAVSALILGMTVLHWQIWLMGDVTAPRGGGDLVSFLYPTYKFAARSIAEGHFPFWNPTLFAGAPFAADLQSGIFYPPNLFAFLMFRPFEYGHLVSMALLHYPLAAIGGYCLARAMGMKRLSAFTAGFVFGGSGFMVAHFGHYNMLASASWVPWLFAALLRGYQLGSIRWLCLAGAGFALVILPGHIQTALYAALAVGIFWVVALRFDRVRATSSIARALSGPITLGTGALGASVLLIPAFELTRLSVRSDISYRQSLEFAASPLGWITFVIPHFFGDNPSDYWGLRWSLQESYGYVGVASLLICTLAIVLSRGDRRVLFLVFGCLLALCVSIGESTALQGLLYRLIPGFDKVRAPGRSLLFVDLSLALLVGMGIHHLRSFPSWRERPLVRRLTRGASACVFLGATIVLPLFYYALMTNQDKAPTIVQRLGLALDSLQFTLLMLIAIVILLWMWSRGKQQWMASMVCGLVLFDVISANSRFNPTYEDILAGYKHDDLVATLRDRVANDRIDTRTGIGDSWQPNLASVVGLNDVAGLFNPLTLRSFDRYWENLGSRSVPGYDLLATKYIVAKADAPLDASRVRKIADGQGGLAVFENSRALPRSFIAPKTEVLSEDAIAARLKETGFDPRRQVLVTNPMSGVEGSGTVDSLQTVGPNEVQVRLRDVRGGYLVVSNVNYAGWTATVDGTATPIQTAYNLFQTVSLPSGATDVRLTFMPRFFGLALSASVFALLIYLISAASLLFNRPRAISQS